jgi:predicted RNase H-like nuclease (RuvC/YqgF family)
MQKFNKKILTYKLKIRDLQEGMAKYEQEIEHLRAENSQLKTENEKIVKEFNDNNIFKHKISRLKTEYEHKMKEIIDEVKGKI